ncbi:NAD(P)-dependent oxidoreductase [Alisedimentitalea sp. MJ-SS2]|uniref:NAD(P)-dependent oxidoreductase n=1 Tax=Aliisedimentitalea sp. MJ-SS2 TaxID=3049795 RepID=UPI002914C138|nr:NAD(P)-dependent oxidoreductase [Alisedimentitalea sp. MJ-SS2]MDU8927053.1 NAD(P)-dependent oxidoreductase [Alisedimentitalea sp. MJ-SS2]
MSHSNGKPVIGFIGVGFMGHGMAKNIRLGGYDLWVKGNRNRTPVDNLISLGAKEAQSAKEIASNCDIVHICLPNSDFVEQIIRGENGILAGAREGLIVIDTTTADPTSTMALAEEMAKQGVTMVDAPLGRTPKEAEEGTLDAMVGCDDDTFAKVQPVIDCWAGTINHVGPVGSAHKMKLLMNFLAMGYGALYAEALSLGAKVGISPQKLREVIAPSRMGNGFFDTFMSYAVDRNRDAHKFTIENASKDVRYANNMASNAGVVGIMASAVKHYYTHVEAIGKGSDFVPMVADHVARLNGLDLEEEVKKGG